MKRLFFILRRIAYVFTNSKLPSMGRKCEISPLAIFTGKTQNIKLANNVSAHDYVRINCHKHGGSIDIGSHTVINPGTLIDTGKKDGRIVIGKNCSFNLYCIIYGHGGLVIGDNVMIGAHVMILPYNHIFNNREIIIKHQGLEKKGIEIGDDVWIGGGAIILDGVKVGKGCVIGAGSVVTKDVADYDIVAGVPAISISVRGEEVKV